MFINYSQNYNKDYKLNYDKYTNKKSIKVNTFYIGNFVVYEVIDNNNEPRYFGSIDDVLCYTAYIPNMSIYNGNIYGLPQVNSGCPDIGSIKQQSDDNTKEICGEIDLKQYYRNLFDYYKKNGKLPDDFNKDNMPTTSGECICELIPNISDYEKQLKCCGFGCTLHLCKDNAYVEGHGKKYPTYDFCKCKMSYIKIHTKNSSYIEHECGALLPATRYTYAIYNKLHKICGYFDRKVLKKLEPCVIECLCKLEEPESSYYTLTNTGEFKICDKYGCVIYTNQCDTLYQFLGVNK